jgi:hypothetical protein
MDVFKGIELKLAAFERLLDHNPDLRGKVVLVQVREGGRAGAVGCRTAGNAARIYAWQSWCFETKHRNPVDSICPTSHNTHLVLQVTNPPRSTGRDITELHKAVTTLVGGGGDDSSPHIHHRQLRLRHQPAMQLPGYRHSYHSL